MRLSGLLLAFVFVLLVNVAAPVAEAQCAPAQLFRSGTPAGPDPNRVRVDATGSTSEFLNPGNTTVVGRMWAAGSSFTGNNFGGTCPPIDPGAPAGGWWGQLAGGPVSSPFRIIDGGMGSAFCLTSTCPCAGPTCDELVIVVEDETPAGDDAYFIALRVDASFPPTPETWDFSRVNPGGVLPFTTFPLPVVTSSSTLPSLDIDILVDLPGVAGNFWGVNGPGNTPLPPGQTIPQYDLYLFEGGADPGRGVESWDGTLSGTLLQSVSVPAGGGPTTGINLQIPCSTSNDDLFLAAGVTFEGGTGPDLVSTRVGQAICPPCTDVNGNLIGDACEPDFDGDGIANTIDSMPQVFSDVFDDGVTSGTITTRGGRTWDVTNLSSPAGVRLSVAGGAAAAEAVDDCSPQVTHTIPGGQSAVFDVTCGSATVALASGSLESSATVGLTTMTALLVPGSIVTFDEPAPGSVSVTLDAASQPTDVVVDGMTQTLNPGESLVAGQPPAVPGISGAGVLLLAGLLMASWLVARKWL